MPRQKNIKDPSPDKKKTVITLQWGVVISTAYLSLFSKGQMAESPTVLLLTLLLLASALLIHHLPRGALDHRFFPHVLISVDTLFILAGIGLSKDQPWDLFLVFFVGLFIASIGENIIQTILGGVIVGIISVFIKNPSQIDPDLFVRIPFLFGVLTIYGYLSEQAKTEKKKAEQQQAILHEINMAMTSTLDLRTMLDMLLEKMDSFLPYATASVVRLFNKKNAELEVVTSRNLKAEVAKAEKRIGDSLAKLALSNKNPIMVRKTQNDPRLPDPGYLHELGLSSHLCVPLISKDEMLGTLSFYTEDDRHLTNEEVQFLFTLSGQASIATENALLFKETKDQAAELEKSNKVKDEFLSVMSHELRTPLNTIVGYTGMIREGMLGEINAEQEKALVKVISRSNALLTMISSILQATQIEAGAAKVERHEVNLRNLLDEVRLNCEAPLDKELTLNWHYPSELPSIRTDGAKLKSILQNLISNALKFTEMGEVTISARCYANKRPGAGRRQHAEGNGQVYSAEFKVADTGIGVPKDLQPYIFEKFRQVDSSETRAYGGVGLGLYIVRSLTELLGGKVEVESKPGRGSTFTVTIPCAQ